MKKQWILPETDFEQVVELQELLDLHPALCKLLIQRGIKTPTEARQFFTPSFDNLLSPFLMKDMEKAVDRLINALENNERILLYGDYDVDGTSAVALMHTFLQTHHSNLDYYIPDRYKEGYGLSMTGIDYAQQNDVKLIITLDCGIKAVEPINAAKALGIDTIICDHHLPKKVLPDALAILDPKQADCKYPFKELCGTGVAFKLAQALALSQGWADSETRDLIDLVAIATACDIVPLIGENRTFAHFGLKRINENPRLGIQALIDKSNRPRPLTISGVVFGIGPMINAAGRLTDARQAVRLLLAEEPQVAADLALLLSSSNEQRKEFDRKMVKEAQALLENGANAEQQKSIVLYQPHWHKGVVGIAAARMVEHYHKPSIILTSSGDKIVGSARSVPGFDIHAAIEECQDLLENFGGHRYAAGLTLLPDNLEAFQQQFEKAVDQQIEKESLQAKIHLVAELQLSSITSEFWNQLRQFAPFGPGHRNPVFLSTGVRDGGHSRLLKEQHIKLHLVQNEAAPLSGIAFGQGTHFEAIQQGPFDICYTIEENTWMGKTNLQLNVKGIRV